MDTKIRIIDNKRIHLEDVINENLLWSEDVLFAVAYATKGAFEKIRENIVNLLNKGGKLRAIFDIEKRITDPEIIEEFATVPGDSECKIFFRPLAIKPETEEDRPSFHPKLYIFSKKGNAKVIIGSSNFTLSGIRKNVEINVEIECNENKDFYSNVILKFYDMWNDWFSLPVIDNWELLEIYSQIVKSNDQEIIDAQKYFNYVSNYVKLCQKEITKLAKIHFKELKTSKYKNVKNVETIITFNPTKKYECSICFKKHCETSTCKLTCGHIFGKSCFSKATKILNNNCPLCRTVCTTITLFSK